MKRHRKHQKKEVVIEVTTVAKDLIVGKSPEQFAIDAGIVRPTLLAHLGKEFLEPVQVWRLRDTRTGKFLPVPQDEMTEARAPLVATA